MEWVLLFSFFLIQNIQEAFSSSYELRLSKDVLPEHYDISLRPDIYHPSPDDYTLYGNVTIYAIVKSRTDKIRLHLKNLAIKDIAVFHQTLNVYKDHRLNSKGQVIITLTVPVVANERLKMVFKYSRSIRHNLLGLYYFHSEDGNVGVTTQLEAIHARQVFPCFDEPSFKATFNVSIYRKSRYRSVSNNELLRTHRLPDDWNIDVFKRTPRMSTYLVAVVVTTDPGESDFYRDVNITIYYPKHQKHKVQFAMSTTKHLLGKYEEFLGIKYPLSKLDSYGFNESDYKYMGMENYGLITYASSSFYVDVINIMKGRSVISLIQHELAHQWFGNLVTMKWWTELWLNEGFASYFGSLRGKWMTEFRLRDIGILKTFHVMMSETKTENLPVTNFHIHSESEIKDTTGDITYVKGAMMVQMLELLLGEDAFRDGLQIYLRKHQYSSVGNQDLLNAMSMAAERSNNTININNVFVPWISQTGFPIVSISVNYSDSVITYSQRPAVIYERKPIQDKLWPIPFQWKIDNGDASKVIVRSDASGTIQIDEDLNDNMVIVNPEANFYYVVEYEQSHLHRLLQYIKQKSGKVFDHDTRAKLLFDIGVLSRITPNEKERKEYVETYQTLKEIFMDTSDRLESLMMLSVTAIIGR